MKIICSIILTIAALAGCAKKKAETRPMITKDTAATDTTKTYLALGDSYTIGEAVPDTESYPYRLVQKINQQGLNFANPPKVIAVTGWTTDNLINAVAQSGIDGKKYDLVTLLIGVNDQYQNLSQDNYRIKFKQVLETAITFAGGNKSHVFVLSIPDWGVTPFAGGNGAVIGTLIDQFNAINRSISEAEGMNYLDITGISRRAAAEPELIAADGLHPSGKMYGLWVDELAPMVLEALGIGH
jgi:lysophospholipase L1-like esterase